MDRKKCITCWPLLLLLALSSLPAIAAEAEAVAADGDVVADRIKRSENDYAAQDKKLSEANELFSKKEFEKALSLTEGVLSELAKEVAAIDSEIARDRLVRVRRDARTIRHAWGQERLQEARKLAADGRYNEAASRAGEVVTLAKDVAELPGMDGKPDAKLQRDAENLQTHCRNMAKQEGMRDDMSLEKAQAANYKESQKQIRHLLNEAATFIRGRRYEEALNRVEQVFLFDPLNAEAMTMAGQLYQLFYRYGLERARTDTSGNMAYAQWQWAEPVFMQSNSKSMVADGTVKKSSSQGVYEKLNRIVYPRISFADADIRAVLNQLEKRSKDYDPDKEGLVINRSLPPELELNVNLSCTDMPLGEILRYICLMTGLEYRVDGNSVLVSSNAGSELRTMKWQVGGKIFSDVLAMDGGNAAGAAVGGGDEAEGAEAGASAKNAGGNRNPSPAQWYNFFTKNLITFPEGWKIGSDAKRGTLSVTSSSDCLREIEELLRQLDVQGEKMVMIEIRALEISEIDSQELGFNWNLGMLGYNMDNSGNIGTKGSTGWGFGQGSNTTNGSASEGALSMIRSAAAITGLSNTAVVKDWNIFPSLFGSQNWFGSDTPIDLRLTINALAQNQRVETLSAPKLLTLNGMPASVSVGKTYYFPVSWDELEISSETAENSSNYVYKITMPTPDINKSGEELGIHLWARPTVQPDNYTIRLELKPNITAYLGKDNGDGRYDVNVYAVTYNNYVPSSEFLLYKFPIWRPRKSQRKLDIVVDVYDGETVVVGGIIDNSAVNRTDKMPILGDLPLIGRFFQSQAENARKQNLIMFVTARQIDFRGNPIYRNKNVGIPDFNR